MSRLSLLLVVALLSLLAAPVSRKDARVAEAVSANPVPVCSGAYCTVTFTYTGDYYTWTAPTTGEYDLKVWGAQGGNDLWDPGVRRGGRGGYTFGKFNITAGTQLHVYVGGQGIGCTTTYWKSTGGGGGTDIRLTGGAWNDSASLLSRIIVAGGGGGRHGGGYETIGGVSNQAYVGNDGGGLTAPSFVVNNFTITGSGQQSGGSSTESYGSVVAGSFGFANPNSKTNTCSAGGWNGGARGSDGWANGGGGGGWYGGVTSWPAGSGGSGYVLKSDSFKPAGYTPTSAYHATQFTILGGNATVPNPAGGTTIGREGNGIATITYLNVPTPTITSSVDSLTNQSSTITYTVNYSESVTGIALSDFQLSGTSTGWTLSSLSGSGSGPYTITVTGSSVASGTLILTQLQNSVFGNSTQQNGPAANTAASTITVDVDRPTASVTSAPSSPAAGMTQTFGLSFSESVSGIAAGDFSNTGTATGCIFTPSAASGTTVNVVVTQCQEGTLQLQMNAGSISDAAGNTGPAAVLQSSVITLQASALTVTAGTKSINYGGSWTDSYSQSGLIGSDTISSVTYSYSGTTTLGSAYGPSSTKPTAGGTYTITPSAVLGAGNTNRYSVSYVTAPLTIARVAQSALTVTSTSGVFGVVLTLSTSGGSGTGAVSYVVSSGSCSVAGNLLTLGDAGSSCSVTATKAADDNYTAVSSAPTAVSTAKTTQATLTVSTTSATYGQDLVLGTSGGSGSGAVSYSVVSGTCTVTGALLTPGNAGSSCVVKATKATDTNYLERSSADTAITIDKATQSVLTVSSTSATYGSTLTLTTSGGSGSGAVSFSVVSGTCTVTGALLTPGDAGSSCVVKATKATETNYLERSSADTAITIDKATQSVLTVTSTSATYGEDLTLTTSGGSGSGVVSFSVVSGTCSVLGSSLTPGEAASLCVVKATKATDTNYLERSSVDTTVVVGKAAQAVLLVTTTSVTHGDTLVLGSSGGSGSGVVSYSVVSGTCSIAGALLTPGNAGSLCVVKATKATEANYLERSSVNTTITINKATQSVLTVSTTSATYGQDLVLGTSGGSGSGAVSFSVVSGTCTVTGALLTPGNAGSSCVVKATKATETNYLERSSADTTITIDKATQSVLTVSSTSATYGSTLTLTTSGGSGSGVVSFSVVSGTCTVTGALLTPGNAGSSCVVKATKATDTNYLERSSADTSVSTAKAGQAVLAVSTTTATYGQDLVLGTSGGSGSGAVSYSVVSGTCSIVGALLTPGNAGSSCVIKATKATDTNYLERSSSNTSITVGKALQTGLSITSSLVFTTGTPLSLTANGGQSTGSLSWSLTSGSCTLTGSTLTATRGGISCVVEVTRAGDSNYFADTISETVTVDKIVQVLTFQSTPPSSAVVGGTYTVQVTSDASLAPTIAIANNSASVCSIAAGVVTFGAAGTCLISATQSGNDVYAAAAASQSITVTVAPTTTTTVPPASGAGTDGTPSLSTVPQSAVPAPVSTTSTTTTTTTIPADPGSPSLGADGQPPQLEAGEATATVRGKRVQIESSVEQGQLVMTLPGNVVMRIGSVDSASGAQVGADGVLRVFGDSTVQVGMSGLVPKTIYTVYMFSDPVELGRGETTNSGAVSQIVTVPKDVEAGEHTLQINGVGEGNEVVSVSMGFEVVERQSNTRIAVTVILLAVALALLGGRPIFRRRRVA